MGAERRRPAQGEGPRHEAREQALALLYEAELKSLEPARVLEAVPAAPDPFALELVEGVAGHRVQIDSLVADAAVSWEIERMPVVDRTILRLATYELLEQPAIPVAVVIDEAVELAKQYSTDASGAFVNGVLSHIARQVHP
ncbi:MAG: transcription antitermination factor NusB [Acidimicrobiales bacterium]